MRARDLAAVRFIGMVMPLVSILPVPGVAAAYTLDTVSLSRASGEVVLDLTASESIRYEVLQLESPDRVLLDLKGAEAAPAPVVEGEDPGGWFSEVRYALRGDEPDDRVARYVIETTGPARYAVSAKDNHLQLCLSQADTAAPAGDVTDVEASPAILDSAPPLGAADPAVEVGALALSAAPTTDPPDGGPPMSLDVQGADIRTVIRSIAAFSSVNIVPDREVSGPISVRLDQVPWRQALEIVCESAALAAVDRDQVIRVATRKAVLDEEIEREAAARKREELLPLKTAVLQVRYANAEELKKSIGFVLSKRGSAEADERTNSILVTDIEERIGQIRGMVVELDTETLQVEIVAKLVDADVTAARILGISWDLQNLHSAKERFSGSVSHDTHIVNPATEFKFGVVRRFGNIDATIQAMERENKANIISNPRITTVNNRKARILVGKQIPLIVLDQAGNPITELKKVGITLEVTPYINSENRVTMDLHPEVSDLSAQSTVQGGIVFTTTEADTRVMVGDGETAVIGGLISTSETRYEEGVPFLRSIPLLGHFFKSSDVRKDHRELLIFVTPRIVRSLATKETR